MGPCSSFALLRYLCALIALRVLFALRAMIVSFISTLLYFDLLWFVLGCGNQNSKDQYERTHLYTPTYTRV